MASPDQFNYRYEAETFVGIMNDLASGVRLDFSPESIGELEKFVSKNFDPPGSKFVGDSLMAGMGCYIGEVIIRTIGGHWDALGRPEIDEIGEIQAIFPIQKVVKRFRNGPIDSLSQYYATILKYAPQKRSSESR